MLSKVSFQKAYLVRILGLTLGATLLGSGPASHVYAAEPAISLPDAVRQAITSNLDLAAQRQALEAARQEIGLARSALLPQVDFGARGQYLDAERSDQTRGNNKQGSFLVGAGLSQVVYDEESWAGFTIQKHVYDGQVQQLESYQLAVIQDAAATFLELDRAQRVVEIQQKNRELTRRNLESSRARIAAGWSSDREILRWEVQLAGNDADVRGAQVLLLRNRLELNRVRNLQPEAPVAALPATVEEYGFVYANEEIARAILVPDQDRRMRDYLVRVGIAHSPDLAAFDTSIAAAERQLTANQRSFWVPTLTFNAGIDYLTNHSDADDFNQAEWGVKGLLSFPVVRGGAKFAGLDQARANLDSLRTGRRAAAQSLEETIRAAFAQASGSFETVSFVNRQTAAARRNFELVDQSYILGVASILDLLDAQAQLLDADLALNNAVYGFLEDLVAAERAISFYSFLQPRPNVEAMVDGLLQEIRLHP
jgi:outer membrane protein TolC